MPAKIAACGALDYLSAEGLPPQCEWRNPSRGRYFHQHRVAFTDVSSPRRMSEILAEQDTPDWFLNSHKWEDFLAIGTWETIGPTGFKMKWLICVNIHDGHVLRVETNLANLHLSLESNEAMAASIEESFQVQPINKARSECIIFINSTAQQMMDCFEKYFSFVNGTIVTAEPFLEAVSNIDRPASESGAMWYLLIADYLHQDEY